MTQNARLLNFLESHPEGITSLEAFNALGCTRLSERVRELTALGYDIDKEWITVPTRDRPAHVVRYALQTKVAYG